MGNRPRILRILFILGTAAMLIPTKATAFEIAAVGSLNLTSPNETQIVSTGTYASQMTIGFGALAGFEMTRAFLFEIGAIYQPRAFNNGFQNLSFTMLEIPFVIRFNPLPIVSFAAGGYVAYGLGNYSAQTVGAPTSQSIDYGASGYNRVDWGLVASVAANIPLWPDFSLLFDLRYYFGLQNLDANSEVGSLLFRDAQLLAGLRYSF
jgi:hypothetical protein